LGTGLNKCLAKDRSVDDFRRPTVSSTPGAEVPLPDSPVPDWLQKMLN